MERSEIWGTQCSEQMSNNLNWNLSEEKNLVYFRIDEFNEIAKAIRKIFYGHCKYSFQVFHDFNHEFKNDVDSNKNRSWHSI